MDTSRPFSWLSVLCFLVTIPFTQVSHAWQEAGPSTAQDATTPDVEDSNEATSGSNGDGSDAHATSGVEKETDHKVQNEASTPTDTAGSDLGKAVELSVRPEDTVRIIGVENRPSWVNAEPVRTGDVHSTVVCSHPRIKKRDCRLALARKMKEVTDEYINEHLESPIAAALLQYDSDYVRSHLIAPENIYEETVESSMGQMHQIHALVEFDTVFQSKIARRWSRLVAKSRVVNLGLVAASILGLLGIAFGYFRLDTSTRGYYTGRLQFSAAIAILALIASGVLLARWIPWM